MPCSGRSGDSDDEADDIYTDGRRISAPHKDTAFGGPGVSPSISQPAALMQIDAGPSNGVKPDVDMVTVNDQVRLGHITVSSLHNVRKFLAACLAKACLSKVCAVWSAPELVHIASRPCVEPGGATPCYT